MRKAIFAVTLILALCQVPLVASATTRVEAPLPSLGGADVVLWINQFGAPRGINYVDVQAETEDLIMHLNGVKVAKGTGARAGDKTLELWIRYGVSTPRGFGANLGRRRSGVGYTEASVSVTIEAKIGILTRDWNPGPRSGKPSTRSLTRTHRAVGHSTVSAMSVSRIPVGRIGRDKIEIGGSTGRSVHEAWVEAYARAVDQLWDNPEHRVSSTGPFVVNAVEGNVVVIEAGIENGVSVGDTFAVFREDLVRRSSTTGEILSQEVAWGTVPTIRVISVQPRTSNCEVISGSIDSIRRTDRVVRKDPASNEAPEL